MTWIPAIVAWIRRHKVDIGIILALLIVAAVPRVVGLGTFLTADEKNWMGRGYEFIRAFKDMRFNDMLQTTHPGVTALWLIGTGITLKMILAAVPFSFQTLPTFVVISQLPIALANAIAVPAMYWLLLQLRLPYISTPYRQRLFAIVASLTIALDPFIVGYSRVAHVDALLGSFLFLAVLATIIWYQRDFSRRWLVASMALTALAVLTKAPAIFMVPFFILVALIGAWRIWEVNRGDVRPYLIKRVRDFIIWLLGVGILFVVIWPVFVTVQNPKGNLHILQRDLSTATATPHNMTESYTLEGSHYFKTILARTTPVTLVLFIASLVFVAYTLKERARGKNNEGLWLLTSYVLFFVIMMTLGAKKGDRYILPVFFAIDALAIYILFAAGKIWNAIKITVGVGAVVVVYLGVVIASYHPYAIAYANPLFPDNVSQELGWGEGLDQVATWLNENHPHARVASWYSEELGAFTSANVLTIGAHAENTVQYVVLYRNMFGRAPDHYANDYIDEYYKKREPVFIAYVHNKPFAWVYEKITYPGNYGEVLPGETISRTLPLDYNPLGAIDVLVATYRGRAVSGQLHVELRDAQNKVLYTWSEPVADFEDDIWHPFTLPEPLKLKGQNVVVQMYTTGTKAGDAPTIRKDKAGNAAIRPLYASGNQLINEEQTKLLEQLD